MNRNWGSLLGKMAIAAIVLIAFNSLMDILSQNHARGKLEIEKAKIEVDAKRIDNEERRARIPSQATPQKVAMQPAEAHDCGDSKELANVFATTSTQVFQSSFSVPFGCLWAEVDFVVKRIDGKNFVIELPSPNDSNRSYQCNGTQECVTFLNSLKSSSRFQDKRVRIILKPDGQLNIYNA